MTNPVSDSKLQLGSHHDLFVSMATSQYSLAFLFKKSIIVFAKEFNRKKLYFNALYPFNKK